MWSKDRKILEEIEIASSTSVFAAGLNIHGDIEAISDIRIEGDIKGNVTTKKKLIVGASGFVRGDILAGEVCIMGEVIGDFTVLGLAKFTANAKVRGNIVSQSIEIEEGADMEVTLSRIKPEQKIEPTISGLKMVQIDKVAKREMAFEGSKKDIKVL
jgi:cytoskeletal protein CcmA (bactofilin family)